MARKVLVVALLAALALGSYAAAPLVAVWQIREAVHAGDTATLTRKVDWPSVRQSLKASMRPSQIAEEFADPANPPKPGLLRRAVGSALPYLAEPLIERYVTPEGIPKLYAWRRSLKRQPVPTATQAGADGTKVPAAEQQQGVIERNLAFLRRIERWSAVSPTRLEIEIVDGRKAQRRWLIAMSMHNFSWHLTEVRLLPDRAVPAQKV